MDGLCREIIEQLKAEKTVNSITSRGWKDNAAICTMHLNPQAQQYGGFTQGRRVYGATRRLARMAIRILAIARIVLNRLRPSRKIG